MLVARPAICFALFMHRVFSGSGCFILLISFFSSCQALIDAPVPNLHWPLFAHDSSVPLQKSVYQQLEGVYTITGNDDDFGDSAVIKWTYDINRSDTNYYLSFFCQEDVRYFIMQGKSSGDSILLNGYWRNIENTKTGKAYFFISNNAGAFALLSGLQPASPPAIRGLYGFDEEEPHKQIRFSFHRSLSPSSGFLIVGHRGGGRNNDLLPASENSIEMLHLASRFGCNGVEIDVKLTRDKIPVLYHDNQINNRLTEKPAFHGPISDYSYAELEKDISLKRGGKIPMLRDALHTILYNTPMEFVWLDCKYTGSMQPVKALQQEFLQKAKAAGRQFQIVIGIPDEDVAKEFRKLPGYKKTPSLAELDIMKSVQLGSGYWGTSWIQGLQRKQTTKAQSYGLKVIVWPLDIPDKIEQYIRHGRFDGALSNRPTAVAYELLSRN